MRELHNVHSCSSCIGITLILKNTLKTHPPHVVAATVDDEAIRCCSFLQVDGKEEGEGLSIVVHPSQTSRHRRPAR